MACMPAHLCRKKAPWVQNMQTAMQAMDVALKQTVSMRNETKVFARAIFWRDDTKSRSLGDGAEVISSLLYLTVFTCLMALSCDHL